MATPSTCANELPEIMTDTEMADVFNMLEAEPTSAPGNVVASMQPDIPALRGQLAVLVSTGKAKDAIGVQLTHEQVKRLSDKDVEKYTKRYEAYVGSKTTDSLIDSFILLVTKVVGMAVEVKDIDAYQKELKNDYIINKELSNLASSMSLKCGRFLAVANAALITAKNIDLEKNYEDLKRKYEAKTISKAHQPLNNFFAFLNNHSERQQFLTKYFFN